MIKNLNMTSSTGVISAATPSMNATQTLSKGRTNQLLKNSQVNGISGKSQTKNTFEIKQILKMTAHHQKMNSQRQQLTSIHQSKGSSNGARSKNPGASPMAMDANEAVQARIMVTKSQNSTIQSTQQAPSYQQSQAGSQSRRAKSHLRAAQNASTLQQTPSSLAGNQQAFKPTQPSQHQ